MAFGSVGLRMRDRAQLVVIGAGIVGASAAYHLAELGITDVLVLDQGPLFETGGSTSHAPGLVFQTNGSRTMCRLAQYSVDLYSGLETDDGPAWYGVGGIEVATTPERMQELKRRRGYALAYGIDGTELLSPDETAERIPILDPGHILGSYLVPSDGIAKGVRVAAALGAKAQANGVAFEGGVRVTGFDIREGRVHGVRHGPGRCRVRAGPRVRRASGARRSGGWPACRSRSRSCSTSSCGPTRCRSSRRDATEEVVHPILRHQDVSLYFRQRGDRYALGNYRHEPILFEPDDLRPYRDGEPQPSIEPFTPEHFEVAYEESIRLLPPVKDMVDETTADQRDVLVHAGHGVDRRRVGGRPRLLDLRGRLGHARRRDGADGRRVDRAAGSPRWTWPRPTRTASTRS